MGVAADPADLELTPTLEETRALAREHTLVPVRHTFIADTETPVSAYLKLRGGGPSFLLESAEQGTRFGRWSFLGYRPRTTIRIDDGVLTVGGEARAFTDPYAVVALELERYRTAPLEGLPPFAGGAVGLFGYDLVRFAEPSVGEPNPDPLDMPDMALMVSDVMVAFDHLRHEATILANVFVDGAVDDAYASAAAAIAEVRAKLAGPVPQFDVAEKPPVQFESNTGEQGYEDSVARCVEYIHAGDAYQVVPSQRWSAEAPGRRVLDLPRAARREPQPVHVLPGLRGLPDRRRIARSRWSRSRAAPPPSARSPAPARVPTAPPRTPSARRSCWATSRSAPST